MMVSIQCANTWKSKGQTKLWMPLNYSFSLQTLYVKLLLPLHRHWGGKIDSRLHCYASHEQKKIESVCDKCSILSTLHSSFSILFLPGIKRPMKYLLSEMQLLVIHYRNVKFGHLYIERNVMHQRMYLTICHPLSS